MPDSSDEKLAAAALAVANMIGAIVKMSDDAENAKSPLDRQGKLLLMQNSIQKNAQRMVPHVQALLKVMGKE